MHFSLIFCEAHSFQLLLHRQWNHSLSRFLLVLKICAISQPSAVNYSLPWICFLDPVCQGTRESLSRQGRMASAAFGSSLPRTHHHSCNNVPQNFLLIRPYSALILWLWSDPSCLRCFSGHISLRKRSRFLSMPGNQWAIHRALLVFRSPENVTHAILPLSPTMHCALPTHSSPPSSSPAMPHLSSQVSYEAFTPISSWLTFFFVRQGLSV